MSPTTTTCPNSVCGKPLNLPTSAVGQSLSCPHCDTGIAVALGSDGQPIARTVAKAKRGPGFALLGVLLVVALAPFFVCGGAFWWLHQPSGREIGRHNLGHGRHLHIWSKGDAWGDPVCVCYRITQNGRELCSATFIGVDHGEQFEFRTAFADNGNLACVYEVNLAADDSEFLIIYDAEHHETWPRDDKDRSRWLALYAKLRAANPDFPRVRHFEQ